MNHRYLEWTLAGALLLGGGGVFAETSTTVEGYTIHHNALTTDMLEPQIATAYGIQRSKNRGMLNVSVIKEVPGTTGQSVQATVRTQARSLSGQRWDLPMREIKDGDAFYYIADFLVQNQESLDFDIAVTPPGAAKPLSAHMSHQFFTD